MKRSFAIISMAALIIGSCTMGEVSDNSLRKANMFSATFEENLNVRTYVDSDLNMYWTADDRISIFRSTLNEEYSFDGATGDKKGTFSQINPDQSELSDRLNAYYAVYPYDSSWSISKEGAISLSLPAVQQYADESFGPRANTMIAVTEDDNDYSLNFKNVCGYIVLKLYGDKVVKSISIKGNNGEKLSGNATITAVSDGAPVISMSNDASETVTIDCGDGISLGSDASTATQFWFCIPPVSLSKGFTVTITNDGGSTIVINSTASRTISRNVVNTLPPHNDSSDIDFGEDGPQDGGEAVISEDEANIQDFPYEEDCPLTDYSEDDLLQMDSIARKLIDMNGYVTKASTGVNNVNNLGTYEVENIIWDAGDWGASHWAGNKITCMYNADYVNGDKVLTIVLYREKGLQSGTAYLKLGTLNSGPCLCSVPISAGQPYVTLQINIDEAVTINKKAVNLLPDYGILNVFPLIVYGNGYREYINQVCIKSKPIVPYGWNSEENTYGYYFGTVNGVGVYHNGNSVSSTGKQKYNQDTDQTGHSCVELCKRYLTTMFSLNRKVTDSWGDANAWPDNRRNDTKDDYLVFANDGTNQVREGDMIVFKTSGKYGHIGVVIKTEHYQNENHISYAHQNGGIKESQRPIGTTAKWDGYKVLYDSDLARETTYFIRKDNANEHPASVSYEEVDVDVETSPIFRIDKTTLDFGEIEVGDYKVVRFNIINSGTAPLVVSSITAPAGFKCKYNSTTVAAGDTLEVPVRFDPTEAKSYDGYCTIVTNARSKKIKINAKGVNGVEEEAELNSRTYGGKKYSIVRKNVNTGSRRVNGDGSEFFECSYSVKVGRTTYDIPGTFYSYQTHRDGNDLGPALAVNQSTGDMWLFILEKDVDEYYGMSGYVYKISNGSISKTTVFEMANFGWFPFFNHEEGRLALNSFSYAGYYSLICFEDEDWSLYGWYDIYPDDFKDIQAQNQMIYIF